MARHRDQPNGWLWVVPSLVIPLIIAAVAWTTHVSSEGSQVAPNVRFAGIDVSGMTPAAAADQVGERESHFLDTPVAIDLGERTVVLTAEEIGYDYMHGDTVSAVVSARHHNDAWSEFVSWAATPFDEVTVADRFTLDESIARQRLAADDFIIEPPVEPALTNEDVSYLYAVPGEDGVGVDIDQVIQELGDADVASGTVEINAQLTRVEPSITDSEAASLALLMNEQTRSGMIASVGPMASELTPGQIRSHLTSMVEGGRMTVSIDVEGFQAELESVFSEPIGDFISPDLEVVDGEVVVLAEGRPAPVCCSLESVKMVATSLLDGDPKVHRLEPRPNDDATVMSWADGSAITEPVATFTTTHACCENRVTNIHTIADALTGVYLIPGQTLSLNEFVGPRTREKGYLPAGAIRGGHMTDEVGGGVSQFVTTIFNAAFLAGLDLDQYQSHSVYFSRYPFGREATLSVPGPDLVLTNSTDYPVLIWPTYDATSITVTMYSTGHIDVEEIDHRISRRRQCTHSEIDRQRTYPDGRVAVDTIVANYRPGDGIDCNGNPIPES